MPHAVFTIDRPQVTECAQPSGLGLYHFDARGIDERFRHAAVFAALGALNAGETMRYYDDQDPVPLLVRIEHLFGPRISLIYVLRHPSEMIIDLRIADEH